MSDRLTAEDIRRNWHEQAEMVFAAEYRRDAYKREMAVHWERIEASRYGAPDQKLDPEMYRHEKAKHAECESKIASLDFLISVRRMVWDAMPRPKPRRPRKTVLVDGIRTKIEREYA